MSKEMRGGGLAQQQTWLTTQQTMQRNVYRHTDGHATGEGDLTMHSYVWCCVYIQAMLAFIGLHARRFYKRTRCGFAPPGWKTAGLFSIKD